MNLVRPLALSFCLFSVSGLYADIVYDVDQSSGDITVTGTITTDGVIGQAEASDITNVDLLMTNGALSVTLNQVGSRIGPSPNGFFATPAQLEWVFSAAGTNSVETALEFDGTDNASQVLGSFHLSNFRGQPSYYMQLQEFQPGQRSNDMQTDFTTDGQVFVFGNTPMPEPAYFGALGCLLLTLCVIKLTNRRKRPVL